MKYRTIVIASAVLALLGVLAFDQALPVSATEDPVVTIESTTTTAPVPQSLVTLQVTTACVQGNPLLEVAINNHSHLLVGITITVDDETRSGLGIEPMSAIYPKWATTAGKTGTVMVQVDYNDAGPGTFPLTENYEVKPCPVPTNIIDAAVTEREPYPGGPTPTVQPPAYMTPAAPPAPIRFTG